jgi:hypothetical protein
MTGAALENLWGPAGIWAADTWTRLNTDHFDGQLRYRVVVFGLTPHGHAYGHTNPSGRITLHPSLLDPHSDAWARSHELGARWATDVLLHEMVHVRLFADDIADDHHNSRQWCDEITRITPQLNLPPVKAAPVKPRRIDGAVRRLPLAGHLTRDEIAHWPHSIRPADYYTDAGRINVPI